MSSQSALAELGQPGPPIRLSVLAELSGWSREKLLRDIQRGDLDAFQVKCGRLGFWHVERDEARRYLAELRQTA